MDDQAIDEVKVDMEKECVQALINNFERSPFVIVACCLYVSDIFLAVSA